jgi:3-deoxy-D-manno-octulosonic-acid transferase
MRGIRFNYPLQDAAQAKFGRVYTMTMLAYSALLTLALTLSAPWWLTRMVTTQRYREGLQQRLRFVPPAMRAYASEHRIVWLHAVSVGEVLAAGRLITELETALGDGWRVAISTTTRTGQALARERFGPDRVFYMPLDFAFATRAYLRALQPAALILMESELWPRLLHECAERSIPVAVVNARISDRSFRRARRVRALWSRILRKATLWLTQSEEDTRRLVELGAHADRVLTTGNLKYDIRAPKQSRIAELIREAAAGRPIIVAGSTVDRTNDHQTDENEKLISATAGLREHQQAVLVLAPRHPELFDLVYSVATKFPTLRATELPAAPQQKPVEIILLDTIGDLASVYSIADIAFVGGSLVKRGGHNPLEPAQFGVPVVIGPSYENFRDVVQRMKEAGGISIVGDAAGLSTASASAADSGRDDRVEAGCADSGRDDSFLVDGLEKEFVRLLTDRVAAKAMGERGRMVFESQQGATARTVTALLAMIEGGRR